MAAEIAIRAYQPSDEHGLAPLFAGCFGRDISAEYWLSDPEWVDLIEQAFLERRIDSRTAG